MQSTGTHTSIHRLKPQIKSRLVMRAMLMLTSATFLVACDDGQGVNLFQKKPSVSADGTVQQQTSTKIVERDIEAPDVFQVTASGLWDGRPSLGGVWVAHSDVTDPERVIIRNSKNGKFVIGALFKRERSTPGPEIQVSSDAAEALGLLAGSPAELNITALRREEVPVATAPEQVETLAPAETIEAAPLDPIADAAATLDAIAPAASSAPTAKPVAPPKTTAPKAAAANLSKPFIQIGIFSVKDNADRTVAMLGSQGLVAIVKDGETSGKAFWRVVVGPASNANERKDLLAKVKSAGFTDAYFVTH
ncbi:SPOR domain-containing protein [Pacificibacter marinus]|uniref:SPOR domain-containing protein n=1 Tax=Pacificibacter marinus TaxID=658057 RepID=UPI0020917C3B|nr:SPOR domain-containing protein [Pacificibacter marinus]